MLDLEMAFCEGYPCVPPHVKFAHVIPFHPKVSADGEICTRSVLQNWSQRCSVMTVVDWISTMLDSPGADSPANFLALELFTSNYTEYLRLLEPSRIQSFTPLKKFQ
jgi:ubiquitin-protein ligase